LPSTEAQISGPAKARLVLRILWGFAIVAFNPALCANISGYSIIESTVFWGLPIQAEGGVRLDLTRLDLVFFSKHW
jgi:hypothetical protein